METGLAKPSLAKPSFDGFCSGWVDGNTLHGWIASSIALEEDITVEARFDGKTIGTCAVKTGKANLHCRFNIKSIQRHQPIDIICARVTVHAYLPGEAETQLLPRPGLLRFLAKIAFRDNLFEYLNDLDGAKYLVNMIELAVGRSVFGDTRLESPGVPPTSAADDLTALWHRAGTICRDRSAILGRGGTIFVYEGGNRLFTQYQKTSLSEEEQAHAANWVHVFAERARYLRDAQVPFVQTIIPEKSTVLSHLYPLPILAPTRFMVAVEDLAKDPAQGLGPCYVSTLERFGADTKEDAGRLYMKTDSHFAARGAMATTRLLLSGLAGQHETVDRAMPSIDALLARARADTTPHRFMVGDLARRFFDVPLYEEDLDIRYETLFDGTPSLDLELEFVPPGGRFNGLRMVWRHRDAPLDLRVVAFGNSFFADGSDCTTLSWWFKHLCREFHFVWSREVDRKYVEQVRPDLVVCQTVERFLPAAPRTFSD